MNTPGWLEQLLVAALAVGVIIWSWPRIRASFQQKQTISGDQWKSVLIPLLIVVLFVLFLIKLA